MMPLMGNFILSAQLANALPVFTKPGLPMVLKSQYALLSEALFL
jgi:hypothetical protein